MRDLVGNKKEAERLLLEDPDEETGFVLHPDTKWLGCGFIPSKEKTAFDIEKVDVKSLYCIAVSKRADVRTLRDLRSAHPPLLKNISASALKHVRERYGVPLRQLRMYVH